MSEATPRINAKYLENFKHQTVRILGKVTQLRGEEATIDASGPVNLHLNRVRRRRITYPGAKALTRAAANRTPTSRPTMPSRSLARSTPT